MPLPILQHPTFELTIPSTEQRVKYRPFLVKEEKILLIAQSSEDAADIIRAIKQIINNCIIEGDINVDELPSFDVEYFFLKLRSHSVNNVAKIEITDPDSQKEIPLSVNLDEVQVVFDKKHSNKIDLNDDLFITMRYPTYDDLLKTGVETSDKNIGESLTELINTCVDKVYDGDDVHSLDDYTPQEATEFIDSLSGQNFQDIQNFFDTAPRLEHTVNYKVGNKKKKYTLRGIQDFLSWR